MAQLKTHKFVAALPGVLEGDSLYFVRTGVGFDLYVTNGAGQITAYSLNIATWTLIEVNLGQPAGRQKVFVAVAGMTATQRVEVMRSPLPATGKGSDEHEAEPVALAAYAKAGGFDLIVIGLDTSIGGPMNINYRVS